MINGEREPRKKWDDDATPPLCALAMCANDAVDNRVANLVLNSYVANSRPIIHQGQITRMSRGRNTAYDVMKN